MIELKENLKKEKEKNSKLTSENLILEEDKSKEILKLKNEINNEIKKNVELNKKLQDSIKSKYI